MEQIKDKIVFYIEFTIHRCSYSKIEKKKKHLKKYSKFIVVSD